MRNALWRLPQQGLTKTYNHLKDPTCTDPAIVELRRLHEEMDRAVLAEYGWDVEVPPYTSPVTAGERRRLEARTRSSTGSSSSTRSGRSRSASSGWGRP